MNINYEFLNYLNLHCTLHNNYCEVSFYTYSPFFMRCHCYILVGINIFKSFNLSMETYCTIKYSLFESTFFLFLLSFFPVSWVQTRLIFTWQHFWTIALFIQVGTYIDALSLLNNLHLKFIFCLGRYQFAWLVTSLRG